MFLSKFERIKEFPQSVHSQTKYSETYQFDNIFVKGYMYEKCHSLHNSNLIRVLLFVPIIINRK